MKTQEETEQSNTFMTGNQEYVNNAPFMMMRLDTTPLIKDIKNFLQSREVVLEEKDGEFIERVKQIGRPLANEEGIMRICNLVRMRVNHHVAQGNLKEDHYWAYLSRARKEITETIVKKCYDFEIHDSNLNMIIDEVCALIETFMTRPINNKERDSYSQQIQARESVVQQYPKQGGWASFASGMGGNRPTM